MFAHARRWPLSIPLTTRSCAFLISILSFLCMIKKSNIFFSSLLIFHSDAISLLSSNLARAIIGPADCPTLAGSILSSPITLATPVLTIQVNASWALVLIKSFDISCQTLSTDICLNPPALSLIALIVFSSHLGLSSFAWNLKYLKILK